MPHCTRDYPWYLTKFALGFASILFFYMGFLKENSSAFAAQDEGNGPEAAKTESIAASARKGSALPCGTDVDAEKRLRLTSATKTTPTKADRQSLLTRPNAAVHEKNCEIAPPSSCHAKCEKSGITRHSNNEVQDDTCVQAEKEETSKIEGLKKIRYPAVAKCGWRPNRFSRCKRSDRCRGRFSNGISMNFQRYRCWDREDETQMPNAGEEGEYKSVEIGVQKFSDDDDSYEYEQEDEDVETFEGLRGEAMTVFCEKRESSRCRCVHGQEMRTIPEEDLVSPEDHRFETIPDSTMLKETMNGFEKTHQMSERKPRFHSRALNRTNRVVGRKLLRYPVVCAEHKCSRCSQHTYCSRGIQSVVGDYFESLIAAIRPKEICRVIQPCTRGPLYPSDYDEVSLDAFRPPKRRPVAPSSILWKVATAVYAISGLLKNGLVKLFPPDEESERPSSADGYVHGDELGDRRNVGTTRVAEQVSCVNCTRPTEMNNGETWMGTSAANRTEKLTDGITNRRWSASRRNMSTGSSYRSDEKGGFETSCSEETSNATAAECASAGYTARKKRKTSCIPKSTTTSVSSVTSLSSSSSFRYSCHAIDDEQDLERKAENHPRQDSVDHEIASAVDLTIDPTTSKEKLTLSSTTICIKRSTSHTEDFNSSDEMDAGSMICSHSLTEVGNRPGDELRSDTDEDVFLPPCSSVRVEPEEIHGIRNLEKPSRAVKRLEYSNKNKRYQLMEERTSRECFPCFRNGSSYRDEIYCSSEKASEPDSATSSNRDYDLILRPRRKFKLSARATQKSSRLNCQESQLVSRNYAVKKITHKTDCKTEQPRETLIHSYLEYFKEVALADVPLEPSPGPPNSRIPRFVRHKSGTSNIPRYKCRGAGSSYSAWGESRQWSQELPACSLHRHKRIRSSSGARRSCNSTSHHFYV